MMYVRTYVLWCTIIPQLVLDRMDMLVLCHGSNYRFVRVSIVHNYSHRN